MDKKPHRRLAPLRKITAEPVTDPLEQAELDEQRKRQPNGVEISQLRSATVPEWAELSRHLPENERSAFLVRLIKGLPPESQVDLFEQLAAQLPADVAVRLREDMQACLTDR